MNETAYDIAREAAHKICGTEEEVAVQILAAARKITAIEVRGTGRWLIWSNEHRAWWRPDRWGYCKMRDAAGRYSFEEALEIVTSANCSPECAVIPKEAMIPDAPFMRLTSPSDGRE